MSDKSITLNLFGRDVNASRTLKKVGDQADKTGVQLKALGKVGVVTGLATALPAALNVVSASLSAVTAAAALAPAVLAQAGAAFGVLALGTAYFGDALKDVRDPKKFAADLKGLSPAARDAATGIRALLPALDTLRLNVQEQLFTGAAAGIRKLSDAYLPILRTRLLQIAAVAGQAGRGLATFLARPQQVSLVDQILAQTAGTLSILSRALQPVTSAFLQLAALGGGPLQGLAEHVATLADRFNQFITASVKSGQALQWIDDGLAAAQLFGGALLSVGRILTGILAAAATSGGGLAGVGDGLAAIADAVNSPAFQTGLAQIFTGLSAGAQALGAVMPQVAAAFAAIAPGVAAVAQALGASLAVALANTAQLIINLAPQINALAAGFAAVAPGLTPVVVGILALVRIAGPIATVAGGLMRLITITRSLAVGVRVAATAFRFLALALGVNPIFLAIAAIGLLVVGLVTAYRHSATFRQIVQAAFRAAATVVLAAVSGILGGLQRLFAAASHIPGIGKAMASTAQGFANAKAWIDGTRASLAAIPRSVTTTFRIVTIQQAIKEDVAAGRITRQQGDVDSRGSNAVVRGPSAPSVKVPSYNAGLSAGSGFGRGVGAGIKKTKDYTNNILVKHARALAERLKNAMTKLADIVKARAAYIKQIRDALLSATAITGFEKDPARRGTPGAAYFVKYLAGRLKAIRAYAANVARLRKLGLNRTTLQQILDAGLEGGADDAAALAGGGKKAIAQVNKTQGAINKSAAGLATGVGNQFYRAGVAAAQGLVRGLKSVRLAMLKTARSLAKGLRDAIRKELKIKSPSRALHEDGRNTGLGFLHGVDSMRPAINRSLTGLSRPTGAGTVGRASGITVYETHHHVHAGAILDETGALRALDRMAKSARSRGYRPHTLALQGR